MIVGVGRRRGGRGSAGVPASDGSVAATMRGEFAARLAGVGVTAAKAISSATLGGVGVGGATDSAATERAGGSLGVEREPTGGPFAAAMEPAGTATGTGTDTAEGRDTVRESDGACSEENPFASLPWYVSVRSGRREFANLESVGATGITFITGIAESAPRSIVVRGEATPANPSPTWKASTSGADTGSGVAAMTLGIGAARRPADMIV